MWEFQLHCGGAMLRATHSLLIVPGLVLAVGCGDNLISADDDSAPIESEPEVPGAPEGEAPPGEEEPAREVVVGYYVSTVSCDAPIGRVEAFARYADTNEPLTNIECNWHFDDPDQAGTTAQGCVVDHEFPRAGASSLTLRVTDLDTGKMYSEGGFAHIDAPFEIALEAAAPACGLELSWNATASASGEFSVGVSPAENVITSAPNYQLEKQFTVQVSEPGAYTVRFEAEDERPDGNICSKIVEQVVNVVECHDHTPTCGH